MDTQKASTRFETIKENWKMFLFSLLLGVLLACLILFLFQKKTPNKLEKQIETKREELKIVQSNNNDSEKKLAKQLQQIDVQKMSFNSDLSNFAGNWRNVAVNYQSRYSNRNWHKFNSNKF